MVVVSIVVVVVVAVLIVVVVVVVVSIAIVSVVVVFVVWVVLVAVVATVVMGRFKGGMDAIRITMTNVKPGQIRLMMDILSIGIMLEKMIFFVWYFIAVTDIS